MNRQTSIVLGALIAVLVCASSSAQSTIRASTSPVNSQGNYHSIWGSVSGDGRLVAFQSYASNFSLTDINIHLPDIFVKDVLTGTTTMMSVDSSGLQGNSGSVAPALSTDGLVVAFESLASNLVPADANGVFDVFVRDVGAGTTACASVTPAGVPGNAESAYPSVSATGRWIAFESDATDLVSGDTNGLRDAFVYDRLTGTMVRASTSSGAVEGNGASSWASVSGDGRFVAFASAATNLVPNDTNAASDVFVKELRTGLTVRASVSSIGAEGLSDSTHPTISADGRYVAFESSASNLVAGDSNGTSDVFVRDLVSGTTLRVSVGAAGVEGNGPSHVQGHAQISADGRYIAFDSTASNLVAGDTNVASDCFVHDQFGHTTARVSLSASGAQAGGSNGPSLSSDGRYVVFESLASNFVAGDTNNYMDVFRRDRGPGTFASDFCAGDGTGTACPCGNGGQPNSGCASSTIASGARLSVSGVAGTSAATDTLVLTANDIPGPGLFFQGDGLSAGGLGFAFGDGLLCVGGSIVRLGVVFPTGSWASYPGGTTPNPIHIAGGTVSGDVRHYQCWYRDANLFCTTATYNLTQGVTLTWGP